MRALINLFSICGMLAAVTAEAKLNVVATIPDFGVSLLIGATSCFLTGSACSRGNRAIRDQTADFSTTFTNEDFIYLSVLLSISLGSRRRSSGRVRTLPASRSAPWAATKSSSRPWSR